MVVGRNRHMAVESSFLVTQKPLQACARRLLLLSCSQRKLNTPGKLAALQRYDGPAFKVVRRYLREIGDAQLTVCVLSAKYGVIGQHERIANYNLKMDRPRALELRDSSLAAVVSLLRQQRYQELFVCMSRTYLAALRGIEDLHPDVSFAAPGQGRKLAHLKAWLYNS
jgi:hypothetical protein